MFSKTAQWYDAIYSFKDYPAESASIVELIRRANPSATSVLDIGCGTGEHAIHLKKTFEMAGIDLDPELVKLARAKNPDCEFHVADMVGFDLEKQYDVVLCLFSSIGYVKSLENVKRALRCFSKHLKPNGAVILEPWYTPEHWNPTDRVFLHTGENAQGKVCRMSISRREGNMAVLDFHYLVGTNGAITHEVERHELGLFTIDEMHRAFAETEFDVAYSAEGLSDRGLYVGRLRR